MNKLVATLRTARMTEAQLLAIGFSMADIDAGKHLPGVSGAASNSTQLIADMTSAIGTTPSATATAASIAAAGPILDLPGMLKSVQLNFQEAAEKLAYILSGTAVQGSLTAPTGGVVTSAADSALYNLLVGIYQILK